MDQIPNDLQPVPEDLKPAGLRTGNSLIDYVLEARQNPANRGMASQYAPSLPTALSLLIPGSGLGGAAMRVGAAGTSQAGEAALEGGNPLVQGLEGAAAQAIPEALPVLGPLAKAGSTLLPGASARATNQLAAQLARAARPAPAPTTPGEYMGKYIPTGIPGKPASTILGPNGQPMQPATPPIPAQVIPHKDLQGWTLGDVLNQSGPRAKAPGQLNMIQALMRLLGAGGQEAVSRGNE